MATQDQHLLTTQQVAEVFPSDSLAPLRRLYDLVCGEEGPKGEIAGTRPRPFEKSIILDANAVLKDLHFLAKTRDNPEARTALQEVIDAGTIRPIAPPHLKGEIAENIPEMAEEKNIALQKLWDHWCGYYEEQITFVEVSSEAQHEAICSQSIPDEDDVPYVALQIQTGAPIHSEDDHIPAMGAHAVDRHTMARLRDYSRRASVQYSVEYGGLAVAFGLIKTIGILMWLALELMQGLRKLPTALQVVLGVFAFAFLFRPKTWRFAKDRLVPVLTRSGVAARDVSLSVLLPLLLQAADATKKADAELEAALADLRPDSS